MKQSLTIPILTTEDIYILRGKPMGKKINYPKGSFNNTVEEWIYYHNNRKESYLFENNRLINCEKDILLTEAK